RVLAAWIREGRIDFGRLDEPLQETVLKRLVVDQAQSALAQPVELSTAANVRDSVAKNQALLQSRYSLARYGEALEAIYQRVAASEVGSVDHLDGEILLDRFLAPERLSLLRVD
ncbi:MAG: hypothetical protein FWG62_00680, partial [Proteobacteria bacterium]|nr:hypothetical protein [Pseudomonadota bacterium]